MNTYPHRERRHLKLVDHTLQKSLLYALVLMEMGLLIVALWALYQALDHVIEENLFRIHFSPNKKLLAQLVDHGTPLLMYMLGVNVLALFVADRIWAFYVYRILGGLRRMMQATERLDLAWTEHAYLHHAVLDQAQAWREHEWTRLSLLRARIAELPASLPTSAHERMLLATQLDKMRDV